MCDGTRVQLLQLFPSVVAQIRFPRKQWFFNTRPSFVEKRRVALQQYLKDLTAHPDVVESLPLRQFLELPSNFVPLQAATPRVPVRRGSTPGTPSTPPTPTLAALGSPGSPADQEAELQRMESKPPPRHLLNLKDDLNILYQRLSLVRHC